MTGIEEARRQVRLLSVELRTFNKIAGEARVSARDILSIIRLLNLGPDVATAIMNMQIAIATANALRATLRLLHIELLAHPIGWLILAISIFVGLAATQQMDARRPRY